VKGSSRTLEYRLTMKSVDPTMVAAGKVRHSDRRLSAQHIVIVDNQSPRKEPSTSERIAAYLREAILSGEIPPGSRIRQEEIAERLGTSRLPLREALRMLEVEGLTQLEVNRSARVPALDPDELDVIYQMRERIETLALRLSTRRQVFSID